jgi:hypothetical protein
MMCKGGLLTVLCSDRLIDAIPGTYDEVKGKKYEGVNRSVVFLTDLNEFVANVL